MGGQECGVTSGSRQGKIPRGRCKCRSKAKVGVERHRDEENSSLRGTRAARGGIYISHGNTAWLLIRRYHTIGLN
jgi:hypothetical protein